MMLVMFILVAVVIAMVLRDRAAVRKSGLSELQPVCAQCYYRLGGWPSPVCPECGRDVRQTGVRTGASTAYPVAAGLFIAFCLFVLPMPIQFAARAVFQSDAVDSYVQRRAGDGLALLIQEKESWRRFPARHDVETTVVVTGLAPGASGGYVNGRWRGTGATERESAYDQAGTPPDRAALRTMFAEASPGLDDDAITEHVDDAYALLAELEQTRSTRARGAAISIALGGIGTPSFDGGAGHGRSGAMGQTTPWARLVAPGVALVLGVFGAVMIRRWCRPGWRAAKGDEWAQVASA